MKLPMEIYAFECIKELNNAHHLSILDCIFFITTTALDRKFIFKILMQKFVMMIIAALLF